MRLLIACFALAAMWCATAARAENPLIRALDHTYAVYSAGPDRVFLGSAFSYAPFGVILTNAHVVTHDQAVILVARDGETHRVTVQARDDVRDIAILAGLGQLGLSPSPDDAFIGKEVFALGAPLELGFSISRGIISAAPRQIEPTIPLRFLQHDAATNPGSSGGPLVDANGQLLGMSTRIADGSRLFVGVSFAISAADLERLVPALLSRVLPPVTSLGVDLRPVNLSIANALNIPGHGALVDNVLPNGIGAKAGLRAGDVITAVNGAMLETSAQLPFLLEAAQIRSNQITLSILRGDHALNLTFVATASVLELDHHNRVPELGIRTDGDGLVLAVSPESRADFAGLAIGDHISLVNGSHIFPQNWKDLTYPALLLVERDGRHLHVTLSTSAPHPTRRRTLVGNRLDSDVHRF